MNNADIILGLAYLVLLFGSWSYVLYSRWRRYQHIKDQRNRRELYVIFPLWLVAAIWAGSIVLAFLFDLTVYGEAVRTILGWASLASLATAGALTAQDERTRNRSGV